MSQENLEIVRRIYEESAQGRFTSCLDLFHPDVEYTRSAEGGGEALGLPGHWRGIDAMLKAAYEWVQTFELLRVEAEEYIEAGDAVVVLTRQRGKAKGSGFPLDEQFADVITLRDGLVVRVDQYRNRSAALEAAGLRE